MFEIIYVPKGLFWADKQQEGHLWSIYHHVTKKSEITEYGFQTKLNKNIGISSSSGFINIHGLYHVQIFHGSIIWHRFTLCQICGFLGYCFLEKSVFGPHIQTHKLKREIFILWNQTCSHLQWWFIKEKYMASHRMVKCTLAFAFPVWNNHKTHLKTNSTIKT